MLLRPGSISRSQVEDVVGRVEDPGADAPRAPGSDRSHYAPATPLGIAGPGALQGAVEAALARGQKIAVLARTVQPVASDRVTWRQMPLAPAPYGRALYAALRGVDAAGADRILVEAVPANEPWAAVADRLSRAAGTGRAEDALSGP